MRDIRPVSSAPDPNKPLPSPRALPELPLPMAVKGVEKRKTALPAKPAPAPRLAGAKVPVAAFSVVPPEKMLRSQSAPVMRTSSVSTSRPVTRRMRLGHRERIIVLGLLGLGVIAGIMAALIFLPSANVQLVLRTSPLLIDERLTIRADAQGTNTSVIPGSAFFREIQVEGNSPVTSSEIVGNKARGSVEIVNRTLEEQKIKEQSRLVTREGTLFYMQQSATIPPATSSTPSRVSVNVEAAEAGETGNIPVQRLNFPALDASSQTLVYAEATSALAGGTGETIKVVKEADLEAARTSAGKIAREQVEQQIRSELPRDWAILEESWTAEMSAFDTTAVLNSRQETIPYTARAVVRVMGYEQAALESRLRTVLEERLDKEYTLFPGPISYTKSVENVNWEQAEAAVSVRVTHTTIAKISLETLQQKIAGRSEQEATKYLEGLPGVRSVSVRLRPFWANSIPRIEKRIRMDLQPERQP